jgi:hypothetical protein
VLEKVVLAGTVTTILVSAFPGVDTRWWAAWLVVAGTVLVYAALDVWRLRTGRTGPTGLGGRLALNTGVGLVAMAVLTWLVPGASSSSVAIFDAVLFAYVVALITTLYDRWAPASWVRRTTTGAVARER